MIPIVHHPAYEFDIGPHVFPTRKYRLILERLVHENTISSDDVIAPRPVTDEDVRLVHTGEYVRKINEDALTPAERMTLEIPFSRELRDAPAIVEAQPTAAPTELPVTNRQDCNAIRGQQYLSEEERVWFLSNCVTP